MDLDCAIFKGDPEDVEININMFLRDGNPQVRFITQCQWEGGIATTIFYEVSQ